MYKFKLFESFVKTEANLEWEKNIKGADANYYIIDKNDDITLLTIFVVDNVIDYAYRHPSGHKHWDRITDMIVDFLKDTDYERIDSVAFKDFALNDEQKREVFQFNPGLKIIDLSDED